VRVATSALPTGLCVLQSSRVPDMVGPGNRPAGLRI